MSVKEKLLTRLLSRPADFTYEEAKTLLKGFGYCERYGMTAEKPFYSKAENVHTHSCVAQ